MGLVVPGALVLIAIARSAYRRAAIIEAASAGVATIGSVKVGALLYIHARPFVVYHTLPLLAHSADNAFPSDHAAAAGLAVAFLWTRPRAFALVALGFALLVGAARIAAQLHWPVDIIAGYAFGIAGAVAGFAVAGALAAGRFGPRVITSSFLREVAFRENV